MIMSPNKMLVTSSRLGTSSAAVADLYRETFPLPLQQRILYLEKPPTKLDDWYKWSINLHNQWKRMQRILGRDARTMPKKASNNSRGRKFHFSKRNKWDPNTMDIDILTFEERNELMKEWKCFNCKSTRHISKDCPRKKKKTEEKKIFGGKELHTYIRGIMKEMTDEEREKFMEEAEETGF